MDNNQHPKYYNSGKIEVIDFIYDQNLNFSLGNVVKYVCRAGKKKSKALNDTQKALDDLRKARDYINFEINFLEGNANEE